MFATSISGRPNTSQSMLNDRAWIVVASLKGGGRLTASVAWPRRQPNAWSLTENCLLS